MRINNTIYKPFTIENIKDKQLIITMLKFEDTVIHEELGKSILNDPIKTAFESAGCTFTNIS
jgi:hypothetical protein